MNLDDPVNANALRYAVENTKVFLMDRYRKRFPHIFGDAFLNVRTATRQDYFVPPSIASSCIVVTGTRFSEESCRRMSCFPFKEGWEACEEQDGPRWIRTGRHFELACQASCREHSLNTEWTTEGKCVAANPLKKALASMPEKLYERASRHVFHGGLDVIDGTLKFNERYCEAYGLDFVDGDCVASGGQKFGEWLFGRTVVRGIKTTSLSPLASPPPPPPLPVGGRSRRAHPPPPPNLEEDDPSVRQYLHELALDLTKDFGRQVSDKAIEKFLRQKAPGLFSRSVDTLATKLALKHSVAASLSKMGSTGLSMFGKAFAIVTNVYSFYEIAMAVLDALDPYDFLKVLSRDALEKIDRELDYTYFKDEPKRPEITPEYIWDNNVFQEDESENLDFMIGKIEEYLNALYAIPPKERRLVEIKTNKFDWNSGEKKNGILSKGLVIILIVFTLMFVQWIHVWTLCLFFVMVWYNLTN